MKGIEESKIPRLFLLMKEKGITAATLSKDLRISKGNISDWKFGRAAPSTLALATLSDYLGTTPEYLLGETDIKEKPTGAGELLFDNEIFKLYQSLSPELQKQADDYLKYLASKSQDKSNND